jgi:hypothetical protein
VLKQQLVQLGLGKLKFVCIQQLQPAVRRGLVRLSGDRVG